MNHRHDARTRVLAALFAVLLLAGALAACGGSDDRATAADSRAPAAVAEPGPPASDVAYEPAYPADVSSEGLSEGDVAQQETPHSHDGGEEHTQGDEEVHGEDEGDHGHPH